MSFLDNTGLSYFYNKLKEVFVRSVNGETPDATGNVRINEVELARNLTAPDAQASIDTFIYRTTGGSASLESGEANLILVNGNMAITGRVVEDVSISTTSNIVVGVSDMSLLRTAVNETSGNYALNYVRPTSAEATTSWAPALGDWSYDGSTTSLVVWGLSAQGMVAPSMTTATSGSGTGITAATVVPNTFAATSAVNYGSGHYSFNFVVEYDPDTSEGEEPVVTDSYWSFNDARVTLSDYGVTVTGTPAEGDVITITYVAGTANTTATISYTAPQQGTLHVATPTKFVSTGFNQFDKNSTNTAQSGVINNATISDGRIISNSGTYVCYCKAVGGDHGYIAESISGYIDVTGGMGWCASIPAIGSTVVTVSEAPDDSVTATSADFTYMLDGYMLVVVSDTSDLMMWCEWSGDVNGQEEYTAYVAPSEITIPTVGYIDSTSYTLPTATYGMPRLGTAYDTINFEANTYIKRIERLAYSASNLAMVRAMDPVPVYDYDSTNIFYVLPTPITYTFEGDGGVYQADDHGTEEFIGTTIPVVAELLYGQNLRDKLRTDVVTISKQTLTPSQQARVRENIGAGTMQPPLVFENVEVTISEAEASVTGTITDAAVVVATFETQITTSGSYIFEYNGTDWHLGETTVTLADYGITITGTPANGDTVTVMYTANMWQTNAAYADFPYKAAVPLTGVTAAMLPQVIFDVTESTSGNYAPIEETYNGGVYIWAASMPEAAITIPTIICWGV